MAENRSAARILLVAVAMSAVALGVFALPVEGTFEGLSQRLWKAQDGLPDQTVNALAQTPDGNLWIGTEGGLVRFDGVRFSSYGRDAVSDGVDRGVNALLVSRNGVLWIGTEGGGVFRYHDRHFERLLTRDGKGDLFVRAIYQDRNGTIWVGSDQGLFQLVDTALVRIDDKPNFPAIFVRTVLEDTVGHLWVGGTRLFELSGNKLIRNYPLPDGPARSVINAMHFGPDGVLWLGMHSGLYRMDEKGRFMRAYGLSDPIDTIVQSADGRIWLGSEGQGIYYVRSSRLFHVSSSQLPSGTIEAAFEDRDGNLWLGTKAGLLRLSPTPVSIIPFPGGADSQFETLYIDRDQSVWVAASTHLFHIRNGVAKPYEFPGLKGIRVRTLLRGRNGDLWIGTDGTGLIHLGHGLLHRYYARMGLSNDFVRVILESRDGTIWVGTDGGLAHITSSGSKIFQPTDGLAYFSINALCEDRDGNIWVGTSRGLSRITGERLVHDKIIASLSREEIWSICQDASGVIWLGTRNGLYGIKDRNLIHIDAASGLVSNRVLQILQDQKGNIWLGGPSSISCIPARDLDDYRPGAHIELSCYVDPYNLNSTAFYRGMQPEGAIAANGDVWFASSKGAVRISPRKIIQNELSTVTIEEILADDRSLSPRAYLDLNPNNRRLEISYAGVDLDPQDGLRYRYQMEGLEPWIEAGARRTAYYTHIPPGHYRFRVQAYEIGNRSRVREASIAVVQEPPFYRTVWFLTLSALTLIGAVFSMYRFRLHQMHVKYQAVNAERMRIAREMHDTVIQGCVGVSTLLEAAQGLDAQDESLRQHLLGYATEQVRSTIESARGAVWALRNISTSNGSLHEHCQELVRRMQAESDIPIRYEIIGEPFKIGEDATHELLMTVKEALRNAISHAEATVIRLTIAFAESEAEIEISDNGRGFDPDMVTKAKGHYGLIGMTERTKLLGGTFTVDNPKNEGTTIRLKIPRDVSVIR